ncbi:hypothetical protein RCL1_005766 [Eukaryota sp. TZLM3-RCL]
MTFSCHLSLHCFQTFRDLLNCFDLTDKNPLYFVISRNGLRIYSSYASCFVGRVDIRRDFFQRYECQEDGDDFACHVSKFLDITADLSNKCFDFSELSITMGADRRLVIKASVESVVVITMLLDTLVVDQPVLDLGFQSNNLQAVASVSPELFKTALAQLPAASFRSTLTFDKTFIRVESGTVCTIKKSPNVESLLVHGPNRCSRSYRGDLFKKALKPVSRATALELVRMRVDNNGILQVLYCFKHYTESTFFEVTILPEFVEADDV